MALDMALLASVRAGAPPVLRFYRWAPACLSFGRNQPTRGRYDLAAAAARGISFVRRPTGGQAVLHDDELTYAVVAPVPDIGRPRDAYRRINQALVAGLRSMGVTATVAGSGQKGLTGAAATADRRPATDWDRACFQRPEAGELVVRGRKLVGSAQRLEGRVILQHGSLLVGGTQSVAEELLTVAPAGANPRGGAGADAGWTTLATELARRPDVGELASALASGFESTLGISLAPSTLSASEAAEIDGRQAQFSSDVWTWRR
jgi:lipoyl(octanoyl) transferase